MHFIFARGFRRLAVVLTSLSIPALSALALSAPAQAAGLPHVAQRLTTGRILHITAFGSSSTEGIGASSKAASYPSLLQADLDVMLPHGRIALVANRGIGGEDIDDMMRRLPAIMAERPELVIWQIGSNDPLRAVPVARFITLTRQGIKTLRAAGIDVMLMGPQLCRKLQANATTDQFRDAIVSIGRQMHVPVIRRYTMMQAWLAHKQLTETEMLSPDGLHMADGGYAMLARAVAREILRDSQPHSAVVADLN